MPTLTGGASGLSEAQVQALMDASGVIGHVIFDTTANTGDATPITPFIYSNGFISSILYNTTGDIVVTFADEEADTNYSVVPTFESDARGHAPSGDKLVTGFHFLMVRNSDGAATSPTYVDLLVIRK